MRRSPGEGERVTMAPAAVEAAVRAAVRPLEERVRSLEIELAATRHALSGHVSLMNGLAVEASRIRSGGGSSAAMVEQMLSALEMCTLDRMLALRGVPGYDDSAVIEEMARNLPRGGVHPGEGDALRVELGAGISLNYAPAEVASPEDDALESAMDRAFGEERRR